MKKEKWQKVLNSIAIQKLRDKWMRTFANRARPLMLVNGKLVRRDDQGYVLRRLQHDQDLQRQFDAARKPAGA